MLVLKLLMSNPHFPMPLSIDVAWCQQMDFLNGRGDQNRLGGDLFISTSQIMRS
jgi:hypothetical protein